MERGQLVLNTFREDGGEDLHKVKMMKSEEGNGQTLNVFCIGTGLKARWQAGPRDTERQGGVDNAAQEPLLGKADGDASRSDGPANGDHRDTILFLARMATADLHVLLLAFTAGTLSMLHTQPLLEPSLTAEWGRKRLEV